MDSLHAMTTPRAEAGSTALNLSPSERTGIGGMFMGIIVDLFLCGYMLHQLFDWMSRIGYRRERMFVRFIVHWSTFTAFAMSCYSIAWLCQRFVYGYGIRSLTKTMTLIAWCNLLDMFTIFSVQLFYLDRAWRLFNYSWWTVASVLPFMLFSAGAVIGALIIEGTSHYSWTYSMTSSQAMSYSYIGWMATTVMVDTLLTIFILYGLWKSKTGWKNTDKVVNRLIRLSVECQLPGSLIAIAFILCQTVSGWGSMSTFFMLFQPKAFVIALLGVLNLRTSMRKDISSRGQVSHTAENGLGGWSAHDRARSRYRLDITPPESNELEELSKSPTITNGLKSPDLRPWSSHEAGTRSSRYVEIPDGNHNDIGLLKSPQMAQNIQLQSSNRARFVGA